MVLRRARRCCSCTARATTTGPSPRASSTRASTRWPRPSARSPRRPACDVRLGPPLSPPALPAAGGRTKRSSLLGRSRGRRRRRQRLPRQRRDRRGRVGAGATRRRRGSPTTTTGRPWRRRCASAKTTRALVVLRHGRRAAAQGAGHRTTGSGRCSRPARRRRSALVPLLAAYDVTRLVTSSSLRCVDTVAPYAETTGWPLRQRRALSEEEATADVGGRDRRRAARRAARAACCAPTGRCCRRCSTRSAWTEAGSTGRDARRAPPQGRGRGPRAPSRLTAHRSGRAAVHVIVVSPTTGRRAGRPEFTPRSPSPADPVHLALPKFASCQQTTERLRRHEVNTHFHPPGRSCPASPSSPSALTGLRRRQRDDSRQRRATSGRVSGALAGGGATSQEKAQAAWRAGFQTTTPASRSTTTRSAPAPGARTSSARPTRSPAPTPT